MLIPHPDLWFNAIVSGISAAVNIYYVMRHANGKKSLRLVSAAIMIYFTIVQILAAVGSIPYAQFGVEYMRPWVPVLFLIPVFDVIVDFKRKNIPPEGGPTNPCK